MEKDLDYLFNNVPLYVKEIFDVFELKNNMYELNQNELSRFFKYIGANKNKIVTYCHKCKKEFPFKIKRSNERVEYSMLCDCCMTITNSKKSIAEIPMQGIIDISEECIIGEQPPYSKERLLNNSIWYMDYYCECTNVEEHKYLMMTSIELKDGKVIVRKIGQNPSMITIRGFDFDKYKRILDRINAYEDYKKAELSNLEHFYVGSYAYLRRIFEKIVDSFLEDDKIKGEKMEKKIDAVKEKFDPRVRNLLKNLYGILSISIHELDEEQSGEYYGYLKTIIDMQLEYLSTEEEKQKQSKELEKSISKITDLINK